MSIARLARFEISDVQAGEVYAGLQGTLAETAYPSLACLWRHFQWQRIFLTDVGDPGCGSYLLLHMPTQGEF